ncbi:hypothetical protein ACW9HJ_27620 [Nocardia gipuzkoensis]
MIRVLTARWTVLVPLLAVLALAVTWGRSLPGVAVTIVVSAWPPALDR